MALSIDEQAVFAPAVVYMPANINEDEDLALSQEEKPGTHILSTNSRHFNSTMTE